MARGPGIYSRAISWLKLLLPLVALGLLSTIFLFARDTDPTNNLPVATVETLSDRSSEMVTSPSYSGTTSSGAMLTMRAGTARPDPDAGGELMADGFEAAMTFQNGGRIDLSAPNARLSDQTDEARLTGGVAIRSSQGYRLTTDSLSAAMTRIAVESDGPVEGSGPAGELRAGRMVIEESTSETAGDGDVRLLFTDGVEMIYEP